MRRRAKQRHGRLKLCLWEQEGAARDQSEPMVPSLGARSIPRAKSETRTAKLNDHTATSEPTVTARDGYQGTLPWATSRSVPSERLRMAACCSHPWRRRAQQFELGRRQREPGGTLLYVRLLQGTPTLGSKLRRICPPSRWVWSLDHDTAANNPVRPGDVARTLPHELPWLPVGSMGPDGAQTSDGIRSVELPL